MSDLLTAYLAMIQLPQSTLHPAGPAAKSLANLGWFIYVVFGTVSVVMFVLIFWAARRDRGTFEYHAPVDVDGGHSWILIGGFVVPVIILAVIFGLGLKTLSGFPMHDGEASDPQIRVVGHQWWWQVQYIAGTADQHVMTANEIHIPVGEAVDIELTTTDVIHSFWVPENHGKVDLIPGQLNWIRLRADAAGTYRGQCGEFCGAQHPNMVLNVVAQMPDDYNQWLAHERENAVEPQDSEAVRGKQMFMSRPCALCHSIRGTAAMGGVAPDLTHIGSRQRIATNLLENNDANLAAWVTHAQALKPGVAMPNVTQFTGEELQSIVAYLRQLR